MARLSNCQDQSDSTVPSRNLSNTIHTTKESQPPCHWFDPIYFTVTSLVTLEKPCRGRAQQLGAPSGWPCTGIRTRRSRWSTCITELFLANNSLCFYIIIYYGLAWLCISSHVIVFLVFSGSDRLLMVVFIFSQFSIMRSKHCGYQDNLCHAREGVAELHILVISDIAQ